MELPINIPHLLAFIRKQEKNSSQGLPWLRSRFKRGGHISADVEFIR